MYVLVPGLVLLCQCSAISTRMCNGAACSSTYRTQATGGERKKGKQGSASAPPGTKAGSFWYAVGVTIVSGREAVLPRLGRAPRHLVGNSRVRLFWAPRLLPPCRACTLAPLPLFQCVCTCECVCAPGTTRTDCASSPWQRTPGCQQGGSSSSSSLRCAPSHLLTTRDC